MKSLALDLSLCSGLMFMQPKYCSTYGWRHPPTIMNTACPRCMVNRCAYRARVLECLLRSYGCFRPF